MKKPNRDNWLRDVEARQRNIVFPDTAANEARFWRNLLTGKQKLSVAQTIGVAVVAIMTVGLVISLTFGWVRDIRLGLSAWGALLSIGPSRSHC